MYTSRSMQIGSPNFAIGITSCYISGQIIKTVQSIRQSIGVGKFPIILVSDRMPISEKVKKRLEKYEVKIIENKYVSSVYVKQRQILQYTNAKIIIFTHDDVLFRRNTLAKVLSVLKTDPEISFVGVRNTPLPADNLFDAGVNVGTYLNNTIAQNWDQGDNYLAVLGRLTAFRTDWFKNKMKVHKNAVSLDAYLYFENSRLGGKYKCIWDSEILFRNPQNLNEHLKKSSRFQSSKNEMESYHKFDNLNKKYIIPYSVILKAIINQFLQNPLNFMSYLLIYTYTRVFKISAKKSLTPNWDVDLSTKSL